MMELIVCFPFIAMGVNILNIMSKNQLHDKFLLVGFSLAILVKSLMEFRCPYSVTTTKNTILRFLLVLIFVIMCFTMCQI